LEKLFEADVSDGVGDMPDETSPQKPDKPS